MELLKGRIDFYRCLHISLPSLPESLESILPSSIVSWRAEKIKAVWLNIPTSQLSLAGVAQQFGFYPHHVNSTGLQMALWLADRPNSLPTYSTHYIGTGGVVFNEKSEILLVVNRYSGIGSYQWRPPGGLVEPNELVTEGACREVLEETHIQTAPLGVIAFREKQNYQFDRPDIYFLVLLETHSTAIKMDNEELTHCEWKNFIEWIDEDQPGDARFMLRSLYTDRSVPPYEFFRGLCLEFMQREFKSANYTAPHYYHLNNK